MKRRSFVKASILTTSLSSAMAMASRAAANNQAPKKPGREFYELRTYTLNNKAQQTLVEEYFQKAAIPALNRLGSKQVGVFTEQKSEGQGRLFVLIPFASLDDFLQVEDKLMKDAAYREAAAAYLNAPATEPAYERIESSLLRAFEHMPQMEVPQKKQRIFELRRYESASEGAGKKKIEMFNQAGEIDIFKKLGFNPVFFGETLIGPMRPNLTYMITFDDTAAHDSHWKAFGSDPEWKKVSAIPEYADAKIVSRITSIMLVPATFSQI
jgi:hypothetical protein